MKQVLFLLLLATLIGVGFGQSKQDILNNLQRGGALDVQDASPTSSYDVLMWDGDELKLVTITVLGTVFPSLDVVGNIVLENDEYIDNSTDGDVKIYYNDDAAALGQYFVISSVDTPNIADNDYLEVLFTFNDDSSGLTNYGTLRVTATDVSDESEDSKIDFKTFLAGTETNTLSLTGNTLTLSNSETIDNTTNGTINLTATTVKATGILETTQLLKLPLHTKAVGDSALGRIFLDAADTTLKMGTGTNLVTIVDGTP